MSFERTLDALQALIKDELRMANEKYGDTFNSDHEGESVIREEVVEAFQEMRDCFKHLAELTDSVFADMHNLATTESEYLEQSASYLAAEAIQIAAMCMKFRRER